ncbi:unnamed protein product [Meganyctiphanes norvegica]|uniref:Uncharacterized protein n=1 Tax=Meganyctiphanes norvegica TaxID=48144 RepID=A0AAV2SCF3_MEGNR
MWIQVTERFSHQKWRRLVKKERRKQKRQENAQERDRKSQKELAILLHDPEYQNQLLQAEQLHQDAEHREMEAAAQCREEWNARDEALHSMWCREQARKKRLREERVKQEASIRAEWEKQQQKEAEEEAKKQEANEEKQKQQTELLQKATEGLAQADGTSHNPEPPHGYTPAATTMREPCPFFIKTGACRFGITCSRLHEYPSSSRSILLPNMYSHFGLSGALLDGLDSDMALEYEDSETYQHFRTFFQDILPEFQKCGRVSQLRVCCNTNSHLRGNVYVQYENEMAALRAVTLFNGRWYAGRQISCMFVNMERWKPAICGMYWRQLCPKGGQCNFLHTFHNPGRMFWKIDQDTNMAHTTTSNKSSLREKSARVGEYVSTSYRSRSRERSKNRKHYKKSCSNSENKHKRLRSRKRGEPSDSKDRSKSPKSKETRRVKQKVKGSHRRSRSRSKSCDYKESISRSNSFDSENSKSTNFQKHGRSKGKSKSHKKSKSSKSHKRSRSRSKPLDDKKLSSRSKSNDIHKSRSRSRSHEPEESTYRSHSFDSRKSRTPSRSCDRNS